MAKILRLLTASLIVTLLFAHAPAYAAKADQDTWYIHAADLPATLLPPPAESGPDARKQINMVLAAQRHISKSDLAAIHDEQHLRVEIMTDAMGAGFTRDRFPETFNLLDRVFADTRVVSENDKQYWHALRPYLVEPRVHLQVERLDNSPSYPSGHTCQSRVIAEVLGLLYPDRLEALRARADDIARHRIEAGAHFPADIEGGRLLAMQMVGALSQSAEFQSDLETARLEIGNAK